MNISMIRGTTHAFNFYLKDTSGAVYNLPEGAVLRFGVKLRASNKEYALIKELTSADVNTEGDAYVLNLCPADTQDLPFGRYCYDVGLQLGSSYFNVISCSDFVLHHNITAAEV